MKYEEAKLSWTTSETVARKKKLKTLPKIRDMLKAWNNQTQNLLLQNWASTNNTSSHYLETIDKDEFSEIRIGLETHQLATEFFGRFQIEYSEP